MTRWTSLLLLGFIPAATAQPVTMTQFAGTATIGSMTRQVVMRFSCALSRGKINNLAVQLDIPEAPQLQRAFDVGPFDGPFGIGGRMNLVGTGLTETAQIDFQSGGSYSVSETTFTFSAGITPGSRASLQKLQAVAAVLSSGPSKLTWRVENSKKGGQPIEATAVISSADAFRIQAAVAPCRGK